VIAEHEVTLDLGDGRAEEKDPFENDQPADQANPVDNDEQNAEDGQAVVQNQQGVAQAQQAAVVNNVRSPIAPGGQLARSLRELAHVAITCQTRQEISLAVANDAEKTALLVELRTRRTSFSALSDKHRFILRFLHEPGTALFHSRAQLFELLTGYNRNWWRAHRTMIAKVRADVGQQQQQAQP
jgi:hypothetical protein